MCGWLATDYSDNYVSITQYGDGTIEVEFLARPFVELGIRLQAILGGGHFDGKAKLSADGWKFVLKPGLTDEAAEIRVED